MNIFQNFYGYFKKFMKILSNCEGINKEILMKILWKYHRSIENFVKNYINYAHNFLGGKNILYVACKKKIHQNFVKLWSFNPETQIFLYIYIYFLLWNFIVFS